MKHLITILLIILTLNGYSQSKSEINEYYKEICAKTEWGGKITPKRFYKDIKIYVDGKISDSLNMELNEIVNELNYLIHSIEISIVEDSSESNVYIYFGDAIGFADLLNEPKYLRELTLKQLKYNWGIFEISSSGNVIVNSKVFIDTDRNKNLVRLSHLLREELTQCLGFPNDSKKYNNSIFQKKWTEVTEFSQIDKEIIKLHYNSPQL